MSHLRKLVTLPVAERRLLLAVTLLLAAVRVGLWTLPLRTVYRLLTTLLPPGPPRAGPPPAVSWAVGVGSVYVPHATCLTQALVAQALLRHHGLPGELRIGVVRGAGGAFEAHAWVESEGRVVVGGTRAYLARFTPLPSVEGLLAGWPGAPFR